ncbi:MFS transporter [Nocardioides sp. CFH 31398]|uniref:MFS transporter n=1 Tax=Nocardioides sp. CFH 31398 TaxID=2919579 RepID=UPI001F0625EE|nr:MFS transporter [Nocardioides sp. CFH 31398]MCH1868806.1 MFS transporter [Nocardioides sp. CFH 31398]
MTTPDRRRTPRATLLVVALATATSLAAFTAPLATITSTAAGLGAGAAGRTWILSSMAIGLGAVLLSAGTLADDRGRRRVFVAGLGLLLASSVVCATAPEEVVFVLGRIGQGAGAAAVIAAGLGLISARFEPGPDRARASGVWGASVGAGIAVGPLVSAGLDVAVGWRAVHVVLAVVSLAIALLALRTVEESRTPEPRGLDLAGTVLFTGAVGTFLAALVEGRLGWDRATPLALAAVAAVLLVAFVVVERRGRAPMLDLGLLRRPAFLAATVAAAVTGGGIIALLSTMAFFLDAAYGTTALHAAWLLLAWSGTSVVTALLARRLPASITGRHQLVVGLLIVALGQLLLTGAGTDSGWAHFLPGLFVAGVASGVVNSALGREAVASVPAGRGGMGSGANNTARYVGSAVGVGVVSAILGAPRPGTPLEGLVAGWNVAAVVTAAVTLAGAVVVALCRERAPRA